MSLLAPSKNERDKKHDEGGEGSSSSMGFHAQSCVVEATLLLFAGGDFDDVVGGGFFLAGGAYAHVAGVGAEGGEGFRA